MNYNCKIKIGFKHITTIFLEIILNLHFASSCTFVPYHGTKRVKVSFCFKVDKNATYLIK